MRSVDAIIHDSKKNSRSVIQKAATKLSALLESEIEECLIRYKGIEDKHFIRLDAKMTDAGY